MSSLLKLSGTQKEAYRGGRNGVRMRVRVKSGLQRVSLRFEVGLRQNGELIGDDDGMK